MERKYIEQTISDIKYHIDVLKSIIEGYQKELNEKPVTGEYGDGLKRGSMQSKELEIEYLNSVIHSLQKALQNNEE